MGKHIRLSFSRVRLILEVSNQLSRRKESRVVTRTLLSSIPSLTICTPVGTISICLPVALPSSNPILTIPFYSPLSVLFHHRLIFLLALRPPALETGTAVAIMDALFDVEVRTFSTSWGDIINRAFIARIRVVAFMHAEDMRPYNDPTHRSFVLGICRELFRSMTNFDSLICGFYCRSEIVAVKKDDERAVCRQAGRPGRRRLNISSEFTR